MFVGHFGVGLSLKSVTPGVSLGTFFLGTAGYVNTFVAQYVGAGRPHRVGASVWQGIHFSIASGLLLMGLIPLAPAIFALVGHEPSVQLGEVVAERTGTSPVDPG